MDTAVEIATSWQTATNELVQPTNQTSAIYKSIYIVNFTF